MPTPTAATWLMALWPAVTLAASTRVPWPLRGIAAALAVVLLDVALLSQSRGSILALPVCAVLFVASCRAGCADRGARPVLGAAAAARAQGARRRRRAERGRRRRRAGRGATRSPRRSCCSRSLAGAVVALVAAWETLRPPAPATAARVRKAWTVVVVAGAIARRGGRPGRRRQPGRPARQRLALVQGRLRRQHGQRKPADLRARIQPL